MDGKYTRPQLDALCINLQIQDLLDFESTTIEDYFTLYSFPFLKIFLTETWSVIMSWANNYSRFAIQHLETVQNM